MPHQAGRIRSGRPLPLGAHTHGDGVNFALFSRHASQVVLELYATADASEPSERIALAPPRHRTGDIWHVWVQGIDSGQCYAYRLAGPYQPRQGHQFNPHKLLLDPYAKALTQLSPWDFDPACGSDPDDPDKPAALDDAASMPKSVFLTGHFDWEDDQPPRHAWADTVIYETHVRGLTIQPDSGVTHPGTYQGLIEKLPYLQDLGISAIELLPMQAFNSTELKRTNPLTGERLRNYWGYSSVGFFAPKAGYSSEHRAGRHVDAFKEMVKACHRAGIEVILDVVFNHTAEGDALGPTLSLRGIDNAIYYLLADDDRHYLDYSGTGNSLNANHPVVRDFILDALRHWVLEMHVDGFRFDLASVLGRDRHGRLQADAPLLERIAEDPILRSVKLIAEAWDAAGAYQVGNFSERRWSEWNGRFRDDVRRFWRGDDGMLGAFASRLCGSADLYQGSGKGPNNSINFVTCHDGFTLNDLVSYARKHNRANGEDERDGSDANYSANYGIEGDSEDPQIEAVRSRQIKNLLLTLLVSRGVPMLLGGDEFRRSQQGNNNAYCQDNPTSWYDWSLLERHAGIHRFVRGLIELRQSYPILSRDSYYNAAQIDFFGPTGSSPNWFDERAKQLGVCIGEDAAPQLCLLFNAGIEAIDFCLPAATDGCRWWLVVDTWQPSPLDLYQGRDAPAVNDTHNCRVGPRSALLLSSSASPARHTTQRRSRPINLEKQTP